MQDVRLEPTAVAARLAAAGIALAPEQVAASAEFLSLLGKWNRVYNLTGIRDAGELVDRHLIESLLLAPLLHGERIADVGTGAGLPGIPLAIAVPRCRFVLIESRTKRVRFLRHVAGVLRLDNVEIEHCRAEHLHCERPFDTVLARAVAPPAELIRITRHLTAPGSVLLLLTAARLEAEWRQLAADFRLRPIAADTPARSVRSSIVVLERIA